MAKIDVRSLDGKKVETIELNDKIFSHKIVPHIMHHVVVAQLANKRQGTASTKTKAEVRGGGRKPWRQKGTGRARHGSSNSPIWVGGGITFGPKPRSYKRNVPKKMKRIALLSAFSSKLKENELIVLNNLNMDEIKTKIMNNAISNITNVKTDAVKSVLIVAKDRYDNAYLSSKNIHGIKYINVNSVNVYDILKFKHLLLTKDAVNHLEEVYAS